MGTICEDSVVSKVFISESIPSPVFALNATVCARLAASNLRNSFLPGMASILFHIVITGLSDKPCKSHTFN
jgi:hypothetical protein